MDEMRWVLARNHSHWIALWKRFIEVDISFRRPVLTQGDHGKRGNSED